MFMCPLFRELSTTTKLMGANIDTIPAFIEIVIVCSVGILWFEFAKNNFACKVVNFWGSQTKGFYSKYNTAKADIHQKT